MKYLIVIGLIEMTGTFLGADELLIPSLTLEDYVARAIKQGVSARQNEWTLESAGYTREVAFRKTDSPTLELSHVHARNDTIVNHLDSLSDSKQTDLTLNETTPLGTVLNATGEYGDSTLNAPANGGIGKPGVTVNVTQPLYVFVKNSIMRTRRQAELNFANVKDTFDSTVLSLNAQARSLYYTIMQGEETIIVEERKVSSTKKLLDVTQALVKAGKSAPVETMRAKLRLKIDERLLQNAVVSRDKAVLTAKNFIYFPLDQPVHFVSKLQFRPLKISMDRLIQYAILHRPQLNTLRRDQELAKLGYEASVEPTRPTLAFNGTYGYNEDPSIITHSWGWTGTAKWLFFDSFVTRDQARIARIAQWVADLNLADAERTTVVNIQSAYLDLKNAERQIQDFASQREQAQHDVEILRLRFQHGLDRLIDVFDAADEVERLDNEYLNILVTYNRNKDTLSQLTGADVETIR